MMKHLGQNEVARMSKKRSKRRKRPFGVTVLAFLQTVTGILLLIVGMAFIFPGTILIVLGMIFLVFAILAFHLARGYLNGHEWARRRGRKVAALAILFAVIGMILIPATADLAYPVWSLLFNILILTYLGRRRVKAFFK